MSRSSALRKSFKKSVSKARSRGIDTRSAQSKLNAQKRQKSNIIQGGNRSSTQTNRNQTDARSQQNQLAALQPSINKNKFLVDQQNRRAGILDGTVPYKKSDFTGFTGGLMGIRAGNFKDTGRPKVREGMTSSEYARFMQDLFKKDPAKMEKMFPIGSGKAVRTIASRAIPFGSLLSKAMQNKEKTVEPVVSSTPTGARTEEGILKAAETIPEGAEAVLENILGTYSPQDMGITAQPGRFIQSPSDMGIIPAITLSPQDMGIRRSIPASNIPDREAADRAFDLAGRAMNPNDVSSRQSPLDSRPMTLQDVAEQEKLNSIRSQIALNTGILANLPDNVDPTQVGDVQGAGQGLQSVFNMQDFVNNNPGSIFPTGYNLDMMNNGIDTGLNFYGGNVAFGNTPEARAALEKLRSNNPNQTFTNMLGGTALRRAEGGIASLYGQ